MLNRHSSHLGRHFKGFEPLEPRVLLSGVGDAGTPEIIPGQYIVVLHDDVDPQAFADDQTARGAQIGHVYRDAIRGVLLRGNAPQDDPRVASIEPDFKVHANAQTTPTGVTRIGADLNPTAGIAGDGGLTDVDVAVLDTGIDAGHPDLNVVGGYNFTSNNKNQWDDKNGHGTHVAGTIAALDNGEGVVGVAPGARLWAVRVLGANGTGSLSGIIAGIDYVTANADVIEVANMSLGGTGYSAAARAAIQNSVAAGVVYVVAAGNDARDVYGADGVLGTNDDAFPAAYPEVATISALADSDGAAGGFGSPTGYGHDDSLATFSNFGRNVVSGNPVNSPGGAIDLALPGVDILSTYPGGYAWSSGTSMAAPHAAGLAALYIAENGRDASPGDGHNAADVYAIRQALVDAAHAADGAYGYDLASDRDSRHEPLGNAAIAPVESSDLAVIDVLAIPSDLIVGDMTQAQVTLRNNGTSAEAFDLQIVSDTGTPDDTSDDILVDSFSGLVLAAGEQMILTSATFFPAAQAASVTLTASHTLVDDNPANNAGSAIITVEDAVTDVAITSVSAPSDVTQGDTATVQVRVDNIGNQDAIDPITVTLRDETAGVDIGSVLLSSGLGPGGSAVVSFDWSTTAAALGGHTLTARHDVVDDDSANDAASAVVNVSEEVVSADLAVTGITPDAAGQNMILDVTIFGSGFTPGAVVALVNGSGPGVDVSNVVVVDSSTITATFTIKNGGPPRDRVWDVQVTTSDGSSAALAGAFTVSTASGGSRGSQASLTPTSMTIDSDALGAGVFDSTDTRTKNSSLLETLLEGPVQLTAV